MIGGDFVVIPSSIHETLAVSADGLTTDGIREKVRDVNDCVVDESERLSYDIYRLTEDGGLEAV